MSACVMDRCPRQRCEITETWVCVDADCPDAPPGWPHLHGETTTCVCPPCDCERCRERAHSSKSLVGFFAGNLTPNLATKGDSVSGQVENV